MDSCGYKKHRFPPQIIAERCGCIFRFPLSLRLVEEMLLERGIVVSYETIRRWGRKFGAAHARQLRRKRRSRKDIWHLDEVVISIAGRMHWLWRRSTKMVTILENRAEPPQHQGCQAIVDQAAEEAGPNAEAEAAASPPFLQPPQPAATPLELDYSEDIERLPITAIGTRFPTSPLQSLLIASTLPIRAF
ncbi:hypothetical protein QO004_003774 [Rhizobium mesoamericanum]|nr:hypothetical protein [Rhizobium mesoamericanum]